MARKEDLLKQLETMEAFVASDEFKELNPFQASQYLNDIDELKQRILNIDEADMSLDELYEKRRLELLEKEKKILETILDFQRKLNNESMTERLRNRLTATVEKLEKDLENIRDEQIMLDEAYTSSPEDYVSREDLGQIDTGIDDEAVAQRNIKEMVENVTTDATEGDARTIYKVTPGEGRQMKVTFTGTENDILQQKAYKFFDELYKKYGPYLARLAYETDNFQQLFGNHPFAPSFQATIIDNKYIYQDLLIIDNAFQSKGYGTSLGMEVLQWALENNLYVIAMPVNEQVRASMLRSGAAHQIGTDLLFFGDKEQFKIFRKEMLEDFKNGVFDVQNSVNVQGLWDLEYNALLQEYNNLFPDEQNLLKNNINHRFHTRNKVHKDTTRLLNYIYSNTPATEVDWTSFKLYETLEPVDEMLFEGEQGDYDLEQKYLKGGAAEEAVEKLYFEAVNNNEARFVRWLLKTNEGNVVLDGLIKALEKNNRTVDDFDWEKLEGLFSKNNIIQEHLEIATPSNLIDVEDKFNTSGRTTDVTAGNFAGVWTGEYSDYDKEWLKNLYDNRYRRRWVTSFQNITGEGKNFGEALSWLAGNELLSPSTFPKLDLPYAENKLRV